MKLNAAKIEEAEAWVRKNGLHPQACGATIRDFCAAMGIDQATYHRWDKIASFASAITRAREVFHTTTVREVENALVKAARGLDFTREKSEARAEKVIEYDPVTGKKVREYMGDPKVIKATRETMYYPPNVEAAKFVLTNMEPDKWKAKQEQTIHAPEGITLRYNNEDEKKVLEKYAK